jgi:hypothetical protein
VQQGVRQVPRKAFHQRGTEYKAGAKEEVDDGVLRHHK